VCWCIEWRRIAIGRLIFARSDLSSGQFGENFTVAGFGADCLASPCDVTRTPDID
jgi:hypothetical protein